MIFVKQRSSLFLQSVLCLLLVAPCMTWEKLGCVWSLAQVLLPLVVPSSMDLWKVLHTVTQGFRLIASCARVAPCVPSCPSGRENGDLSMGFPLPVPHEQFCWHFIDQNQSHGPTELEGSWEVVSCLLQRRGEQSFPPPCFLCSC